MKEHKLKKAGILVTAAVAALVINGRAQSVDSLLDKLVDKGILTVKEANELRTESDKDFDKAYATRTGMPDWVTSLKFVRTRYENFTAENPLFVDRNRFRFRLPVWCIQGHIVKLAYSPYDSITLSVKWFGTELINGSPLGSDSKMNRIQADALWRF